MIQPPKEFLRRPQNPDLPGLLIELPSILTLITLSGGGCQETNLGVRTRE